MCFVCCLVLSCLVLSCLVCVLSCLVLSCLVLSCQDLVLSCLVLSCLVLSCLVLSCLVLSCLVLSCLVLSCVMWGVSVGCVCGVCSRFSWVRPRFVRTLNRTPPQPDPLPPQDGPGASKHHQKTTRRHTVREKKSENGSGRGEKKSAKFCAPHPSRPHPSGPHFPGPQFSGPNLRPPTFSRFGHHPKRPPLRRHVGLSGIVPKAQTGQA